MSDPAKHTPPPDANETQINAVLAEFGGGKPDCDRLIDRVRLVAVIDGWFAEI